MKQEKQKKENLKKQKGISLIVLIITIVVVIILAAAVILTIGNNNPIESAKKATYVSDIGNLKGILSIEIGQRYLDAQGSFNVASLNGQKLELMINNIPEKYHNKFIVQEGQIRPICNALTEQESEWLKSVINTECVASTTYYTDVNGVTVPVPAGYTVSTIAGENTVAEGLVIKEGSNAATSSDDVNEFVWVPVDNINELYDSTTNRGKLYDFSSGRVSSIRNDCLTTTTGYREPDVVSNYDGNNSYDTAGITKAELQNEFNAMIASVKKYKGFYIGRYETGNLSQTTPVVRKLNTDISNQTWYNMYVRTRNIVSNESAQTGIIWGCQWDATLRWMNKDTNVGNYVTNGTGKGNYYDQTFTYVTDTSNTATTKEANTETIIPTGAYEGAKVKNIYDMAGNVWDWTMEANVISIRVLRGGDCGEVATDRSAFYRGGRNPFSPNGFCGVRVQLYLK